MTVKPLPVMRRARIARASLWSWTTLSLAGIVLLAFALRAYSVGWQLPFNDHPDEPNLVNYAKRALATGDLNPHVFRKPHFYLYVLLPFLWLHYRLGIASGEYAGLDLELATTHKHTTIPGFFVWGRMVTVVVGALTTLLVYQLGKRMWNARAGVLAALFVATSPFLMRHSQMVTTDIGNAFMCTATFMAAYSLMYTGRWRDYLVAGLLAGLTAATKYNGGAIVTAIIAAHLLYWGRASFRQLLRLVSAGATTLLGFVLGSPFIVLAWREFRAGILQQIEAYNPSPEDVRGRAWDFAEYGKWLWDTGFRPIGLLALCLGIFLLLRYRRKDGLLWLSFAVPYLLVHLSQQQTFMRNLTPLLTLGAIPVGIAGAVAIEWLQARLPRLSWAVPVGVVLALFVEPLWASVELTRYQALPDSRALALPYLQTLPRGQRIAVDNMAGMVLDDPAIERVGRVTDRSAAWYRANNYRFLMLETDRHQERSKPGYDDLKRNSTVVQHFPGERDDLPGPEIEVLDLGQHPDALALEPRPTRVGGDLRLLGYELKPGAPREKLAPMEGAAQRVFKPGEALQLNLTWQADQPLPHDYALFIHVLDAAGNTVAQRDALIRQNNYQTSRWRPGEIVVDLADMPLPALPAGTYRLRLGVYRMETGERLPLDPAEPGSNNTSIILTEIEVRE